MNDYQQPIEILKNYLEKELALAEMVLAGAQNPNKKIHEPTTAYFRGQADTIKKLLALVDEIYRHTPLGVFLSWLSLLAITVGVIVVFLIST